jgi:hypothetical protein
VLAMLLDHAATIEFSEVPSPGKERSPVIASIRQCSTNLQNTLFEHGFTACLPDSLAHFSACHSICQCRSFGATPD